jgi:cytochrome c biogenesis protein
VGQNLPEEVYRHQYSPLLFKIITTLSITDIYHTIYFNALLLLLLTNIIFCTLKFAPKRLAAALDTGPAKKNYPYFEVISTDISEEKALSRIKKALYRPWRRMRIETEGRVTVITADPHPFLNLGALLVHVSIVLILAGGLLSLLFGFSGDMVIAEGESTSLVFGKTVNYKLDFMVMLDRFTFLQYDDGTPKEYKSEITFFDGEHETEAVITVNHPAKIHGIRFYQSSFGNTFHKAVIAVKDRTGATVLTTDAFPGIPIADVGRNLAFVIVDYAPDYMDDGPAVHLLVRDGEWEFGIWVLIHETDPKLHPDQTHTFVLLDYTEVPFSGLSVSRKPGLPLVWAGFIILCVGISFPLMLSSGSFRAEIKRKQKKGMRGITLSGAPGKIRGDFQRRFSEVIETVRKKIC